MAPWIDAEWIEQQRQTLPAAQFKRLILNEWTSSESAFVSMSEWDSCCVASGPIDSAPEREVWCGLDLGIRHDASALMIVSWEGDRLRLLAHKVFIPTGGVPLDIEETVEREILSLRGRYRLRGVIYDPWQLIYLRQRLEKVGVQRGLPPDYPWRPTPRPQSPPPEHPLMRGRNY